MVNTENRVNIKARIDRHLRIVRKENGLKNNSLNEKKYSNALYFVLIFVVFIFPLYPTLASFVYNNSEYDFYRGNIDESSIIEAYTIGETGDGEQYGSPIIEVRDSFLSVNTILDDSRDLSGTNEIINYEVKPGDSFSSISYEFGINANSILWANDFEKNHVLRPGQIIKIPPVSGLIHTVNSGDTISSIAKKYEVDEVKIKEQNLLAGSDTIKVGDILVIPGAIKKAPPPVIKPATTPTKISNNGKITTTKVNKNVGGYSFANQANSQIVSSQGSYSLVRRAPKHTFYWGNCTWYVAQYKNVTWGGNANQWLSNARANGVSTGSTPKLGAIVQFTGTGYNPRYGHVGIVMEVKSDHIIVSDMNYRKLNEITYRKVPLNDRSIDGYIYVD
ncbi:MAG: LysM peptidoglycan-binding domain-containing protein [Candidatus Gracilibacteria bacterium]|nr:LysM peptidoglycan-binding domain-containing protein [Candidatus Gracilibacteria bacterium]